MRTRVRWRVWIPVVSVCVLSLAMGSWAVGCDDLTETEGTETTETSLEATTSTEVAVTSTAAPTTTTTSAPATTTTVKVAASEELLPSGRIKAHGFITDAYMDGSKRKLEIDYIDMFWDPQADVEAMADGQPTDGDWYARNNNPLLRTFVVSDTVTITTYSRDYDEAAPDPPCSWSDFMSFWGPAAGLSFADQQIHNSKWFIEREGDVVVHIQEVWTP